MGESSMMAERRSILPAAVAWHGVRYEPVEAMARFVLRGSDAVCSTAAEVIGLSNPSGLRASHDEHRAILWQGPDEWLILSPEVERVALLKRLETALTQAPHALVDVSHRNVAVRLEGEAATRLLATGIMLDLDEAAFPVGMTTRTLFGKADVTLWRQAPQRFHLETWRSFAPYVIGLLQAGARGL